VLWFVFRASFLLDKNHLSYTPSPVCFPYFSDRVSLLPGAVLNHEPSASTS
jgi:hypothetical protein